MSRILLAAALVAAAPEAWARDPLLPGAAAHAHAGIGAVVGDDPTLLFTNPAGVAGGAGFRSYGEMRVAGLRHSYKHPGFEEFAVSAVAPLVAIGGSYGTEGGLTFAAAAYPTGIGTELAVEGLPQDLTPSDAAATNVVTKLTAFDAAIGANLALFGQRFTLGLGAVHSHKAYTIKVDVEGADSIVDAKVKGSAVRFVAGGRAAFRGFGLGLSISPPVVRRYEGSTRMPALNQPDPQPVDTADYLPLTVTAGLRLGRPAGRGLNVEYAFEGHAAGRGVARTGMGENDAKETNLRDAHAVSVSGDLRLAKKRRLSAGVGYFQGKLAEGTFPGDGGPKNLGVTGLRFSDFDGLDRAMIGLGLEQAAGRMTWSLGGSIAYGETVIEDGHPGQGRYTFLMTGVTAALRLDL